MAKAYEVTIQSLFGRNVVEVEASSYAGAWLKVKRRQEIDVIVRRSGRRGEPVLIRIERKS